MTLSMEYSDVTVHNWMSLLLDLFFDVISKRFHVVKSLYQFRFYYFSVCCGFVVYLLKNLYINVKSCILWSGLLKCPDIDVSLLWRMSGKRSVSPTYI